MNPLSCCLRNCTRRSLSRRYHVSSVPCLIGTPNSVVIVTTSFRWFSLIRIPHLPNLHCHTFCCHFRPLHTLVYTKLPTSRPLQHSCVRLFQHFRKFQSILWYCIWVESIQIYSWYCLIVGSVSIDHIVLLKSLVTIRPSWWNKTSNDGSSGTCVLEWRHLCCC